MKTALLVALLAGSLRAETLITPAPIDPYDALYITGFNPDYSLGPSIYSGTELWSVWESRGTPEALAASQAAHFIAGYQFVEIPAPVSESPEPGTFAIASIGILALYAVKGRRGR